MSEIKHKVPSMLTKEYMKKIILKKMSRSTEIEYDISLSVKTCSSGQDLIINFQNERDNYVYAYFDIINRNIILWNDYYQ
jgi:Holliday junction resolvase RusA-like endonuclease